MSETTIPACGAPHPLYSLRCHRPAGHSEDVPHEGSGGWHGGTLTMRWLGPVSPPEHRRWIEVTRIGDCEQRWIAVEVAVCPTCGQEVRR